jgi:hypothetical protein
MAWIQLQVPDSVVAYLGDDLPDLPVTGRVGLAVAVGNAVPEVKETAHYTTKALAGHGAIRETVELILKSKGIWDSMIDKRARDAVYAEKLAGATGLEPAGSPLTGVLPGHGKLPSEGRGHVTPFHQGCKFRAH